MFRAHRLAYLPLYTRLLAEITTTMSHPECLLADRSFAVFLIDDVLEFCGDDAIDSRVGVHYAAEYLPVLLRDVGEKNEMLRQSALFGLGGFAENCHATALPHLPALVGALMGALDAPIASHRTSVEDNAVTALGKVIMNLYSDPASAATGAPPRNDVVARFLAELPLKRDHDEAKVALDMLCTLMERGDVDIFGAVAAGDADLPRISHALHVLADAVRDLNVRSDALEARVAALLATLRASLPGDVLGAAWAAASDVDRATLTEVMEGAARGAA